MKQLRKDEIKKLDMTIEERYGVTRLSKKDRVAIADNIISVNDSADFFLLDDVPVPTLRSLLRENFLKSITVDMGAVRFMTNGADVMRPGVISIDESIKKDDVVSVVDEKNKKPLCVVVALFDGPEMAAMKDGKIARNIHHVGDKVWGA